MKRFAIGDLHGCLATFEALPEKLEINKEDELYLLGDYINKGPDSKGVLDKIIALKESGYKVFPVRGNHDQKLLDVLKGNVPGLWSPASQLKATLNSFGVESPFEIGEKYINLIRSMPYFMETEDCFLVHAGFNFYTKDMFLDKPAMLNIKKIVPDRLKLKGKRIVHGHIPLRITEIEKQLSDTVEVINIDSGCVYYETDGMGILTALDLDRMQATFQKNIDAPFPGGKYKE